jgi:hypothetical protein
VPPGFADYVVEVRGHGDHFTPQSGPGPTDAHLLGRAEARATELGILPGARVLIDAARHPDPVVLCANQDPARLATRLTTEKVTHSLP